MTIKRGPPVPDVPNAPDSATEPIHDAPDEATWTRRQFIEQFYSKWLIRPAPVGFLERWKQFVKGAKYFLASFRLIFGATKGVLSLWANIH